MTTMTTGNDHKDTTMAIKESPYSPAFLNWSTQLNALLILEATANRLDYVKLPIPQSPNPPIHKGPVLPAQPTGMAIGNDLIAITTDHKNGYVHLLGANNLSQNQSFRAGAGSRSPVFLRGDRLAICHTWLDEVGIYSLPDGKLTNTIPVLRQPYVSVVSNDGKYLIVANFITHQPADQDTVATALSVINLEEMVLEKNLLLANGSNALRGMTLSEDGDYVLISHNLGRFQVPTTQLEQGWMNTSALSVIQVSTMSYEGTVLLDEPEYGAAGSWGISCSDQKIFVAHSGTHDLSVIDADLFFSKLEGTVQREVLSYDLNFLSGIRERIKMPGNGPRAVWSGEAGIFVGMYFSDTVNQLKIDENNHQIQSIALNAGFYESTERLGEKYFNDASLCFQGWQACNGCHPMDARTDGLNWDLLNDGVGNPKNCKSLLLSHQTPPVMISGIRPDAETAVRAGFKFIQFASVPDETASAVDAYLNSLNPVPSPYLEDGQLSESARAGKVIFKQQGCAECHPAPLFTDLKSYPMEHAKENESVKEWDTPTLVEVWRSGPYLYDGRCASMEVVFSVEKHGITTELTDNELDQLVEFVMSL